MSDFRRQSCTFGMPLSANSLRRGSTAALGGFSSSARVRTDRINSTNRSLSTNIAGLKRHWDLTASQLPKKRVAKATLILSLFKKITFP
jgi:hypothetical protein